MFARIKTFGLKSKISQAGVKLPGNLQEHLSQKIAEKTANVLPGIAEGTATEPQEGVATS